MRPVVQGDLDAVGVDAHLVDDLVQELSALARREVGVELVKVAQHSVDRGQRERPALVDPELPLLVGDGLLERSATLLQSEHAVAGRVHAGRPDGQDGVEQPVALRLVGGEVGLERL
ncbi:MAG: hypothetical protein Q8P18_12240 [Pseudomonadota bacterium]|nr:hypothetical protein [Pseudomonadota bacterium]